MESAMSVLVDKMNFTEYVREKIRCLRSKHIRELNVHWYLFYEDWCDEWYFSCFNWLEGSKKGNGKIAFKEVCELADELDIVVSLKVVERKLFDYYELFGFILVGKVISGTMRKYRRDPKGKRNEC